jgi:hypothetical protein
MGIPKHFPCPECGNDGSDVDELEWQVKELTEQLAKANERVKGLELGAQKICAGVVHFNHSGGDLNPLLTAYIELNEQLRKGGES